MRGTAESCPRSRRAVTSSSSDRSSARPSTRPTFPLTSISRIGVTCGPGLIGALLVGLSAAKAIAWSRRIPLVPVDHLQGHVASLYLGPDSLEPPFVCLLASGGHTLLLAVRRRGSFEMLGSTLDDAAGEAFDKGARILGLPYPGGRRDRRAGPPGRCRGVSLSGRAHAGARSLVLGGQDRTPLRRPRSRRGTPRRAPRRSGGLVPARDRPRPDAASPAGGGDRGSRPHRRRRRGGSEQRAPGGIGRRRPRPAVALHRQCRHDRVGGAVRRPRPEPEALALDAYASAA